MLITFAFILTPLIPLQDPILRRTPIERPASKTERKSAHQAFIKLAELAKTADYLELVKVNLGLRKAKQALQKSWAHEGDEKAWQEANQTLWEHISPLLDAADPQVRANAFFLLESPDRISTSNGYEFDEVEFLLNDPAASQLLLNHLKDDDIRWNFQHTCQMLWKYFDGFRPLLEKAMFSDDSQMRNQAIRVVSRESFFDPSPETLEIQKITFSSSWHRSNYFIHYKDYYYDFIMEQLHDGERVLAAEVIALTRMNEESAEVVTILCEQLKSDDIAYNASEAARALFVMGDIALPYLSNIYVFADQQQKAYVELLIWDITNPPLGRADLELRSDLSTPFVHSYFQSWEFDPVLQGPAWGNVRGELHWLEEVECYCGPCRNKSREESRKKKEATKQHD